MMIECGVFGSLETKPGKKQAVADFPAAGLALINRVLIRQHGERESSELH